ncbi:MAG: c-type cytochrome [Myxococcota bacterium]
MSKPHLTTIVGPLALLALLALVATGCNGNWREMEYGIPAGEKPHFEFNFHDMWDSPSFEAQELGMRPWAPETISVKQRVYPSSIAAETAPYEGAKAIHNPVPMTLKTLAQGKAMYETYCIVCHGPRGLGNGSVIGEGKYTQRPPSLASSKLRAYLDGQIFHVITNGQGSMSHYRSQVRPMERWAIVHYVRALQRAEYPRPADVKRFEQMNKGDTAAAKP